MQARENKFGPKSPPANLKPFSPKVTDIFQQAIEKMCLINVQGPYDYLWKKDALSGLDQGKTRPACLVGASSAVVPGRVLILPITHSPPVRSADAIEIPLRVKRFIGLDDASSWVIASEYNIDSWPNGGLSPIPGKPNEFNYGFIPPDLISKIQKRFLEVAPGKNRGILRY